MWMRFSCRYQLFNHYCKRLMHLKSCQRNPSMLSNSLFPYFLVSPTVNQECKRLNTELFIPLLVSTSTDVKSQENHKQRRFFSERPADELLSVFLSHLVSSINCRYLKGKNISNTDVVYLATQADVFYTNAKESATLTECDKNKTLEDCFLSEFDISKPCKMFLQINFCLSHDPQKTESLIYTVHTNPARILHCRLNTIPMVGCPMVPYIEHENICLEKSEFLWFVGQPEDWPNQPCHKGFIFTPAENHLGFSIRLRIRARDMNGMDGVPFGTSKFYDPYGQPIQCKSPVLKAPIQEFHQQRYKLIENDQLDSQRLRVVSYNILAEMYARSDLARTGLFAHCPEDFIISAYRLPLILRELFSYQSDIICLQEVDRWVYDKHLLHAFKYHQNMDGLFLAKRAVQPDTNDPHKVRTDIKKEKDEGCAIFYSSSRFELVSQYDLPSILHYASTVPFLSIMLDNLNSEKLNSAGSDHSFGEEDIGTHIQKSLSQCLLAGVFRVKSTDSQPTFFIVSNTHFYFHPSASAIRVIQAHTVRHHLLKIAMQYNQPDSNPIPIIFCGDINQSPGSGPYTALTQGDNCLSQEKTTYQPTFESVYANNPPEFTNWVPGFYSVLDVILYNTDSNLRCIRFLPIDSLHQMKQRLIEQVSADGHHIPDDSKLGLPNAYFPSDHVALVADFSWDSLK